MRSVIKRFLLLFVVLFSLSVDACLAPIGNAVYVSDSFSEEERASIVQATKNWEQASKGRESFDIIYVDVNHGYDPLDKLTIIKVSYNDPIIVERDMADHIATLGYYRNHWDVFKTNHYKIIYLVYDRIHDQQAWVDVTTHELGHHLGLGHVIPTQALMHVPRNHNIHCLTQYDMNEYGFIHMVSMSDLDYCNGDDFPIPKE